MSHLYVNNLQNNLSKTISEVINDRLEVESYCLFYSVKTKEKEINQDAKAMFWPQLAGLFLSSTAHIFHFDVCFNHVFDAERDR